MKKLIFFIVFAFTGTLHAAPSVQILAPLDGATITGSGITISGTASDASGIDEISMQVDGGGFSPFAYKNGAWATLFGLPNGSHVLTIRAHAASGLKTETSISITMNNPVVVCSLNGAVTESYLSGVSDISPFIGRVDCDISPDLSAVLASPTRLWKRSLAGVWGLITQGQYDASVLAASTAAITSQAIAGVDNFDSVSLSERGFALVSLDEINNLREWIESFKAAVAAASSLANLQTRVAALPAMPDRTKTQIIPAVKTKISGGGAD